MKTLKEKIINKGKRIGLSLIPFAFCTPKGNEVMAKINPSWATPLSSRKDCAYFCTNTLSSVASIITLSYYLYSSFAFGTPNMTKWGEIENKRNEIKIEVRKNYEKNILDKSFLFFDLNGDNKIDKEEFYEKIRNLPNDTLSCYNKNIYDGLNSTLRLKEKYVPKD